MACFSPLLAWQLDGGEIVFCERGKIKRELNLPCGQCIGCRLDRSRQWAVRCVHESQLHGSNVFVTLTYSDDFLPTDLSLHYRDFQLFMKRLRKVKPGVRFYMCGEYGELGSRPHFHACLFNCFFDDRVLFSHLSSGSDIYTSAELEKLWPFGFCSVGDVTFESAAYVARYVMKKVTGPRADAHYERVDYATGEIKQASPEFNRMSLKPGIGGDWFRKFRSDVYERDYVVVNGVKMKPPKYYDKLLQAASDFSSDYIEFLRSEKARKLAPDNTPERLVVRETVARARLALLKRCV